MLATGAIHDTWQIKAACRGPESTVFFPPTWPERRDEREARESAREGDLRCVRGTQFACLEYALQIREPHGIWGGLTENERRAVLDHRAR